MTSNFSAVDQNHEAQAAFAFIAETIEQDSQGSLAKSFLQWKQLLNVQGYEPEVVENVMNTVIKSNLNDAQRSQLFGELSERSTIREALLVANKITPLLTQDLLSHINHGAEAYQLVLATAGGAGQRLLNTTAPSYVNRLKTLHSRVAVELADQFIGDALKEAKEQQAASNREKRE